MTRFWNALIANMISRVLMIKHRVLMIDVVVCLA